MKKFLLIILVMTLLVVGCRSISQQENPFEFEERTYYESLDLSTPENAVITFTDAFARNDFFTVWLVLTPSAQSEMTISIRLLQWENFIHSEYTKEIGKYLKEEIFGGEEYFFMTWLDDEISESEEHLFVEWYEFEFFMLAAKARNALLVDLSMEVTILNIEPPASTLNDYSEGSLSNQRKNATNVIAMVEGIDGEVIFRMVQAPSGRWRVLQVVLTGGNEEIIPWSAPQQTESLDIKNRTKVSPLKSITYYESLDLSSPESAVKTFIDAFVREDFLTVFLTFSSHAQYNIDYSMRILHYGDLIQIEEIEGYVSEIIPQAFGLKNVEHYYSKMYIFDQLMLYAENHSALLIDLNNKYSIIRNEPSESQWAENTMDVVINMVDFDGEIIFRTVQAPSGRWRVLQVILPGGDEENVPWAVPPQDE